MSGQSNPGPMCGYTAGYVSLTDGTLARWLMPAPGPAGGVSGTALVEPPLLCSTPQVPDLRYLFNSCLNPKQGFGETALADAARALAVELNAIMAVAKVETGGKSFLKSGRPKILFERHYFHRITGGVHSARHPNISNPAAGGYRGNEAEYERLQQAFDLNAWAALQSASWGGFQLMGEHYATLAFASPHHMAQAMAESEDAHLRAFVRFILADRQLLMALRRKDWTRFARGYNGPNYDENDYDTKMQDEYDALVKAGKAAP